MKIGVLMSRVRLDEKMLLDALQRRGVPWERLDDDEMVFNVNANGNKPLKDCDVVLIRSIQQSRALYAAKIFNSLGIPTVNSYDVIATCNDKLVTTSVLVEKGLPCPETRVAFSAESALRAIEEIGYPVVLKPLAGSWGRLLAKINDRDAAEAVLEHKEKLGSYQHSIFYIQEYINKPGRDIRVVVIGDEPVAAMYRNSEHWITNAARGSNCTACRITPEIGSLALKAAKAVGGGAVAVDLLESEDRGLLVCEINSTMEFKSCAQASGVDIADRLVDYVVKVARR